MKRMKKGFVGFALLLLIPFLVGYSLHYVLTWEKIKPSQCLGYGYFSETYRLVGSDQWVSIDINPREHCEYIFNEDSCLVDVVGYDYATNYIQVRCHCK